MLIHASIYNAHLDVSFGQGMMLWLAQLVMCGAILVAFRIVVELLF
jgi:hypothetical protein